MKVLHLSDFHYSSQRYTAYEQLSITDRLLESIGKEEKLDYVFFTGDLVSRGENKDDFLKAYNLLLEKVAHETGVPLSNIIVCPGNHDVDRSVNQTLVENFIKTKINSNEALNSFLQMKDEFSASLSPISNYNDFVKIINEKSLDIIEPMYTIHRRNCQENNICLVTINSAWRALKDDVYGELLYPVNILKEILEQIKDCEFRILLQHHPLYWFKEFNSRELRDLIHKEFHMLFTGHIHESNITASYKDKNGIFYSSVPASYSMENSTYGFSIVDYDFNEPDSVKLEQFSYLAQQGKFISDEPLYCSLPIGQKKKEQNDLRKKINKKYELELNYANDLILEKDEQISQTKSFLKLFNKPNLKTKSKSELVDSKASYNYPFEDLLKNNKNYIIFGYDKSGKTSILKYIQLHHLKEYTLNGIVPFYLDYNELHNQIDSNFDLLTYISRYYELNKRNTKSLIENHRFRLLIDNYDPKHTLTSIITDFLEIYSKVTYVTVSPQLSSRIFETHTFDELLDTKLYIHDLTRKEIRSYTGSWLHDNSKDEDAIVERIIGLCKQLELPVNYWTVSLLLLIHKRASYDYTKNLFEVLDLCVDEMINRKLLIISQARLTTQQIKRLCGEIAYYLLMNHAESTYSTSYIDLLAFLTQHIEGNIRISADPQEVLEYLLSTGILKKKTNKRITYRLNGVFEYFLAFHASNDTGFLDQILEDDQIYLSFKNEFEIYSGIKSNDKEFLIRIFKKTKTFFHTIEEFYSTLGGFDDVLCAKIGNEKSLSEVAMKLKTTSPFHTELKDQIEEEFAPLDINSDVEKKELFDTSTLTSEVYERYISILAKVFKTVDNINDQKLTSQIFKFIIDTYVHFGFFLIDELESSRNESNDVLSDISKDAEKILELLSKIIPLFIQVTMSNNLAHHSVEKVILSRISDLESDSHNNQYELFLLYFILMDIDPDNIIKYTDDLIGLLRSGLMKYSTILKLNYYFAFKAHKNKTLEQFLRKRIQDVQLSIDSKKDKGSIQMGLEEQKKRNFPNEQS